MSSHPNTKPKVGRRGLLATALAGFAALVSGAGSAGSFLRRRKPSNSKTVAENSENAKTSGSSAKQRKTPWIGHY